ncbi:unnamed protein product, partial [Discosporangium mesarthrocarpum]
ILGFFLGFIGFGGTEFFRRVISSMGVGQSSQGVGVLLAASALAQLLSCLVTCPWEAVRIRVMTQDVANQVKMFSFVEVARRMLQEDGLGEFYSGLGALLFRELPFAIAKFLTFEVVRSTIFEVLPAAQEGLFSCLVVSIMAGMTAGVVGAIVSNPADTILTTLNTLSVAATPAQAPAPSLAPKAIAGGRREGGAGLPVRARVRALTSPLENGGTLL